MSIQVRIVAVLISLDAMFELRCYILAETGVFGSLRLLYSAL